MADFNQIMSFDFDEEIKLLEELVGPSSSDQSIGKAGNDPTLRKRPTPRRMAKLIAPLPIKSKTKKEIVQTPPPSDNSVEAWRPSTSTSLNVWDSTQRSTLQRRNVEVQPPNVPEPSPLTITEDSSFFVLPRMSTPPRAKTQDILPTTPPQLRTPPADIGLAISPHGSPSSEGSATFSPLGSPVSIRSAPSPTNPQGFDSSNFLPFLEPEIMILNSPPRNWEKRKQRFDSFKIRAKAKGEGLNSGKPCDKRLIRNRKRANARRARFL